MSEIDSMPGGLVIFKIDVQELCLDIKFLNAILKPNVKNSYEPVFHDGKSYVKYNDSEYLFVDLSPLSATKKLTDDINSRMILIEYKNHRCAFIVKKISEVVYRDVANADLLKFVPVKDFPNSSGYIEFGGRNLWLLDLDKITATSLT